MTPSTVDRTDAVLPRSTLSRRGVLRSWVEIADRGAVAIVMRFLHRLFEAAFPPRSHVVGKVFSLTTT
jgi:hypothetical protein